MAIEYTVELACDPKRQLGTQGLIRRLRVLRQYQEGDTSVEDAARRASFDLRPLAYHCAHCPANHARREYGCSGSVALPIAPEAEQWLIDRLPGEHRQRRGAHPSEAARVQSLRGIHRLIQEHGILGVEVDRRRGPDGIAEARRGRRRGYGVFGHRLVVTSSQLLEAMFLHGAVSPALGELICRVVGAWEDGEPGDDDLANVFFDLPPQPRDPPSVIDLKQFLFALIIAGSLDLELKVVALLPGSAPPTSDAEEPFERAPAHGPTAGREE